MALNTGAGGGKSGDGTILFFKKKFPCLIKQIVIAQDVFHEKPGAGKCGSLHFAGTQHNTSPISRKAEDRDRSVLTDELKRGALNNRFIPSVLTLRALSCFSTRVFPLFGRAITDAY